MPKRIAYILGAALLTGGLAAYLAFTVLRQPGEPADARAATVEVVDVAVAAREMGPGTVVESEDVRLVEWPADAVPDGFSRSPAEVVGRGLLAQVKANEPLLSSKLAGEGAGGGLSVTIPEGMRAMSVQVDEVIGVAGFVLPGTRVDVFVTLDQAAGEQEPKTRLLLQNVEVASAGQTTERDEQGDPQTVPVITLLVNPEQGERLALASSKGRIQMALRNTLDTDTVNTSGVRAARLVDGPPAPTPAPTTSPAPRRPSRFSVDVYRGPDMSTSTVEERSDSAASSGGGQ